MPAVNGQELRKRRVGLGLKVGEFAKAARIAPKTVANIECAGSQPCAIEVVHRFARILGTEPEELLLKTDAAA